MTPWIVAALNVWFARNAAAPASLLLWAHAAYWAFVAVADWYIGVLEDTLDQLRKEDR